jgi:hypothetical protein
MTLSDHTIQKAVPRKKFLRGTPARFGLIKKCIVGGSDDESE